MRISVIICTYNPRQDYLHRTLDALRNQTFPIDQWELLLIDNNSSEPIADRFDVSWHPSARVLIESESGLTNARVCGVRHSNCDLLVFVDDDNVLDASYLANAINLFDQRPDLGAASGCIIPEYEAPPPDWFRPFESWIAVRRIERSYWSNFQDSRSEPCGAGLCLRMSIARNYCSCVEKNKRHKILGRSGGSLLSGEDVAIAKQAIIAGFSIGQFTNIGLTHLIPKERISEKYLFTLYRSIYASGQLISWVDTTSRKTMGLPNWRFFAKAIFRVIRGGNVERRLVFEEIRGMILAKKFIERALVNMLDS